MSPPAKSILFYYIKYILGWYTLGPRKKQLENVMKLGLKHGSNPSPAA